MNSGSASAPSWDFQVMNLIKDIHKNEEKVKVRSAKVKDLFQEDPGNWAVPNYLYVDLIMREYFTARVLFSIGFYYLTLDCCRKIIELLIRFQQDTRPEAEIRFIERIQNEMPWKPQEIKIAEEIYRVGCAAVHSQRSKIWDKSKTHSKLDEPSTARILDEKTPEELKHLIPSIKRTLHGTLGMEVFTLGVLNNTTELVNKIIKENEHKRLLNNLK